MNRLPVSQQRTVSAAAAIFVLLVGACGSDDGGAGTEPDPSMPTSVDPANVQDFVGYGRMGFCPVEPEASLSPECARALEGWRTTEADPTSDWWRRFESAHPDWSPPAQP